MSAAASKKPEAEWFARPDAPEQGKGLRFACTMCGNCCTGPSGYVLVSDEECEALAKRLGKSIEQFKADHTHVMSEDGGGRSINEHKTAFGLDCVFLDRQKIPGKAVCGVYEDRPAQCRTWPFWPSLVASKRDWDSASKKCPGMNKGELIPIEKIRILRDTVKI